MIGDRVTRLTAKYLDRRLAPAELTEVGNTPAETLRAGMRQKVLCDVESSGFIRQVYPVAVTRNLYVAACAEDFLLDGYEIGATSALKNVCLRPDYTDAVYREEGLKAQLAAPLLPMRGWREMLEALKAQRRFVEISRTEADCREEFYFGRIRETTERAVTLDIFDELGGWTSRCASRMKKSARWPSACARWNCSAAMPAKRNNGDVHQLRSFRFPQLFLCRRNSCGKLYRNRSESA